MKLNVLATALLGGMLTFNSVAAEMSKTEQAAIEKVVHEYLVSHPEILIEMSNALRAKQETQQADTDKNLLQQHANQIFKQADDPVAGTLRAA
jgi:hypothetical protein